MAEHSSALPPRQPGFFSRIPGWFITPNRRPRKWIVWIVALYAMFCLLFGLILPHTMRDFAAKELSTAIGAESTIGKIRFNPFTLTLAIEDVAIQYPEKTGQFFSMKLLELSPGFSSIKRFALALGHLKIVRPVFDVTVYPDGQLSTSQFLQEQDPEPDQADKPPFPFILSNLEIIDGELTLHDHVHAATHTVKNLHAAIPFASTLQRDRSRIVKPTLNATIDGQFVRLDGRTTPFADNQRTEFRLHIGQIPLDMIQPYLTTYTELTLAKGALELDAVLQFEKSDTGLDVGVAGTVYADDLELTVPGEGAVLTLDYGKVDIQQSLLQLSQFSIAEVMLDAPMVRVSREKNGSFNWQRYMRPPEKVKEQPAAVRTQLQKSIQQVNALSTQQPEGQATTELASPALTEVKILSGLAPFYAVLKHHAQLSDQLKNTLATHDKKSLQGNATQASQTSKKPPVQKKLTRAQQRKLAAEERKRATEEKKRIAAQRKFEQKLLVVLKVNASAVMAVSSQQLPPSVLAGAQASPELGKNGTLAKNATVKQSAPAQPQITEVKAFGSLIPLYVITQQHGKIIAQMKDAAEVQLKQAQRSAKKPQSKSVSKRANQKAKAQLKSKRLTKAEQKRLAALQAQFERDFFKTLHAGAIAAVSAMNSFVPALPQTQAVQNTVPVTNGTIPETVAVNGTVGSNATTHATLAEGEQDIDLESFIQLKKLTVRSGRIVWKDATIPGGSSLDIRPLGLEVRDASTKSGESGYFTLTLGDQSVASPLLNDVFLLEKAVEASAQAELAAQSKNATQVMPQTVNATIANGNATQSHAAVVSTNSTDTLSVAVIAKAVALGSGLPEAMVIDILASDIFGKTAALAWSPATIGQSTKNDRAQPDQASVGTSTATGKKTQGTAASKKRAGKAQKQPAKKKAAAPQKKKQKLTPEQMKKMLVTSVNNATQHLAVIEAAQVASRSISATNSTLAVPATNGTLVLVPAANATFKMSAAGNSTVATVTNATASAKPQSKKSLGPSPFGDIAIRGTFSIAKRAANMVLLSDKFPLAPFAAYLKPAGVTLTSGTFESYATLSAKLTKKGFVATMPDGSIWLAQLVASVASSAGTTNVKLKKATLSKANLDLGSGKITLGSLALDEPVIQIHSGATASTEKTSTARGASRKATAGPQVLLEKLTITRGQFDMLAAKGGGANSVFPLQLSALDATITNISTAPRTPVGITMSTQWSKSGKLAVKGKGTISPIQLQLDATLGTIPLAPLSDWVQQFMALNMTAGTLSGDLAIEIAEAGIAVKASGAKGRGSDDSADSGAGQSARASSGLGVALGGQLHVAGIELREKQQEVLVARNIHMTGIKANLASNIFDVGAITIESPRLVMTLMANGMNTLSKAFDVSGEKTAEARRGKMRRANAATLEKVMQQMQADAEKVHSAVASSAQGRSTRVRQQSMVQGVERLSIGRIVVQNGNVRLRDESVPGRAIINIAGLAARVDNISTVQGTSASLQVSGRVEGAPFTVTGKSNPLYMPLKGNMEFNLQRMDMTPLSPYAEKFIAYPIKKGTLTLDVKLNTDGMILNVDNKILLGKMALGDKVPGKNAPDVPVKLGLSLLADGNGDVAISLPVTGRLDDPELRTGGIVGKVLGNIFVKVLSSPFSLLGAVVGGSSDEPSLEYIGFASGDDRVPAASMKNIQAVVDLLKKRPKVSLVLQGVVDVSERDAMPAAFIQQQVQQRKWESLGRKERENVRPVDLAVGAHIDSDEYTELVFEVYADQPFPKQRTLGITRKQPLAVMLKMIADSVDTSETAMEALGQRRANAVKEEVLKLAPELAGRVVVDTATRVREGSAGQTPGRVELGVK